MQIWTEDGFRYLIRMVTVHGDFFNSVFLQMNVFNISKPQSLNYDFFKRPGHLLDEYIT